MKIKTWQRPVSSNMLTFASATETLLVAQGKYQPSRTPLSLLSPFNLGKKNQYQGQILDLDISQRGDRWQTRDLFSWLS